MTDRTRTTTNSAGVTTAEGTLGNAKAKVVVPAFGGRIRAQVGWASEGLDGTLTLRMTRGQAYALLDTLQAALDDTVDQ